jgi:hypothetical protein
VDIEDKKQTRFTAVNVKCMRQTRKYTWSNYKRNQDILVELKTESALTKILNYRKKWVYHADKMQRGRLCKLMTKYKQMKQETKDNHTRDCEATEAGMS